MRGTLLALLVAWQRHSGQDWAKARLEKSPRRHEQVVVNHDGRDIATFIVYPGTKDKKPVVLLIHDPRALPIGLKASPIKWRPWVTSPWLPILCRHRLTARTRSWQSQCGCRLRHQDACVDGKLFVAGIGWGGAQSFRFAANRADVVAALVICGASPDKDLIARIKGTVFGFYAANDTVVNATVPPAQAAAKAADVVFEAVTYDGVGPGFIQSGDAPDAKPADKLARGYALERMKSVLDMVSLRGY